MKVDLIIHSCTVQKHYTIIKAKIVEDEYGDQQNKGIFQYCGFE